jgi:hypothetical protein
MKMNTLSAIINGSRILRNERKQLRKLPPHPQTIWTKNVNLYYVKSANGAWVVNHIELPSPYNGYDYKTDHIWKEFGWWQNQWKEFIFDRPSVYNGGEPLPTPYRGPSNIGNPLATTFNITEFRIQWWRDYYASQGII